MGRVGVMGGDGVYKNPVARNRWVYYADDPVCSSLLLLITVAIAMALDCLLMRGYTLRLLAHLFGFNCLPECWDAVLVAVAILVLVAFVMRKRIAGPSLESRVGPLVNTRLTGKTAIITGANSGIGFESAIQLAKWGATVIMACRDEKRGEEAVRRVKAAAGLGNSSKRVELRIVDLSSFESIRQFCSDIQGDEVPIHILLNNAGVMMQPKLKLTVDGWEEQFGINFMGHYLLTNLLLDRLNKYSARIINVSSMAHGMCNWQTGFEFAEVTNVSEAIYKPKHYYAISKLSNVWFTHELQRRLVRLGNSDCAKTYTLHPGVINTPLDRHMISRTVSSIVSPIKSLLMKNATQGAVTQLFLCVADEKELMPGGYYYESDIGYVSPAADSPKKERELWDIAATAVGIN